MLNLEKLDSLHKKIKSQKWSYTPSTMAGSVWIYSSGQPLAEPETQYKNSRYNYHLPRFLRKFLVYWRVRLDEIWKSFRETQEEFQQRRWEEIENTTIFIVELRNAYPEISKKLQLLKEISDKAEVNSDGSYEISKELMLKIKD